MSEGKFYLMGCGLYLVGAAAWLAVVSTIVYVLVTVARYALS